MLVFGNISAFPRNEDFIPVNFTGMNENVQRLQLYNLDGIDISSPEFDRLFAEVVYNIDDNFINMFEIIQLLAAGDNIFICTSSHEICEYLNESLAKFIQQRYGYNYQMVNEESDIDLYDDSSFTITGLYNYDIDKERYINIMVNRGLIEYME